MPLRKLNLRDVKPFDYDFGQSITAQMADIGRAVGSASIGLAIQTVRPGCWSSRRHRHLFQEEILVVMAGDGTLHHGDDHLPVKSGDYFATCPAIPKRTRSRTPAPRISSSGPSVTAFATRSASTLTRAWSSLKD